jgi:hypothetical protein
MANSKFPMTEGGFMWGGAIGLVIGVMVVATWGGLFGQWIMFRFLPKVLAKFGLALMLTTISNLERERKKDEKSDGGDESKDEEEKQMIGLMHGQCRGCGNFHIGLVPAHVELSKSGDGSFDIPRGTPAVCPRCWCKMNPMSLTNTVPMPPVPQSVATGRDDPPEQPSPRTSGYPKVKSDQGVTIPDEMSREVSVGSSREMDFRTEDRSEAPKPKQCCDNCGKESERFRAQIKDGAETGKFWCQACIDALAGPKPKKKNGK